MTDLQTWKIVASDVRILRELFFQKREIAEHPVMAERRQLWLQNDTMKETRPMILAETSGILDEVVPLTDLRCQESWARELERSLRELVFRFEHVGDDYIIEPRIEYRWDIEIGNFGVEVELVRGDNQGKLGSYHWDPPLNNLDADLDRLHYRSLFVNRERTAAWKLLLEENFGDILPVVLRGNYWWTSGLTWDAINLMGLQPFMLAMYDNPSGLHRLMSFLRDDFMNFLDWFEKEDLLTLNNENDYIGSGSMGYTHVLPGSEYVENGHVKISDLWGLLESQETVGVSPAMFEEFILPYQIPIAQRYGLVYYGCCEPIHSRIHSIMKIPNLRRLSVSPWCDQQKMLEALGDQYTYCRKPNPTLISTDRFDEEIIRDDLRTTLRVFRGKSLELVMKDVHTLRGQPERIGRWVQLARDMCAESDWK